MTIGSTNEHEVHQWEEMNFLFVPFVDKTLRGYTATAVGVTGACRSVLEISWYSASSLTAQQSRSSCSTMLLAAISAVAIEWSWLLYRCWPLRPTQYKLSNVCSHVRITSSRCW